MYSFKMCSIRQIDMHNIISKKLNVIDDSIYKSIYT